MLFTPLLASTATGTLEFRSVAEPVRSSLPHCSYQRGRAVSIDPFRKVVSVEISDATRPVPALAEAAAQDAPEGIHTGAAHSDLPDGADGSGSGSVDRSGPSYRTSEVEYDFLVVGVGARSNDFGIEGVNRSNGVHFLKELADARAIRQTILRNVEAASFPGTPPEERRRLLSFALVGGGPTCCEMAAELHDLVMEDLWRAYPESVGELSITLIEGQDILGAFDEHLRQYAKKQFARQRIRVKTGAFVTRVTDRHVVLSTGEEIEHGLVVWATGIAPRKLVGGLDRRLWAKDGWGHIVTDPFMRALGLRQASDGASAGDPAAAEDEGAAAYATLPGVFAIGDCCAVAGRRLAATAQVAEQQGNYVASLLNEAASKRMAWKKSQQGGSEASASSDRLGVSIGDSGLETEESAFQANGSSSRHGLSDDELRGVDPLAALELGGVPIVLPDGSESEQEHEGMRVLAAPWTGFQPFQYSHAGSLAYIGSWGALADLRGAIDPKVLPVQAANEAAKSVVGGDKKTIAGWWAWLVWRSAYLTKLGAWRNRA